jgi:hypothetical protein
MEQPSHSLKYPSTQQVHRQLDPSKMNSENPRGFAQCQKAVCGLCTTCLLKTIYNHSIKLQISFESTDRPPIDSCNHGSTLEQTAKLSLILGQLASQRCLLLAVYEGNFDTNGLCIQFMSGMGILQQLSIEVSIEADTLGENHWKPVKSDDK